jgi:hypothetical protein
MICRPILKNVKNWILDKVGGQHKTAYEIPVTQVFNSRIVVFILNKIAMFSQKKAKAVCYGIIRFKYIPLLFQARVRFIEKGEAMLSCIAEKSYFS